jgi:hypothetical protein
MIALLSPAKTMKFDKEPSTDPTDPRFTEKASFLSNLLKSMSKEELKSLMDISDNLTELNYERYQRMAFDPQTDPTLPALDVFEGDVYKGIDSESMDDHQWDYAQKHIRILSGLYGLLRPKDNIQAYRLEMGTKLQIDEENGNLYDYWTENITKVLKKDLDQFDDACIINLASNEYIKAVDLDAIEVPVLKVKFREWRDGKLKFISFNAKKARGLMTRYMMDKEVSNIEDLKGFDYEGYSYDEDLSEEWEWMFTREN